MWSKSDSLLTTQLRETLSNPNFSFIVATIM